MDLTSIAVAAISAAGTIGVAIVGVRQHREQKASEKREALNEEREAMRQEGALIQMEMSQAGLALAQVTAKAVTNQKVNGDVEDAMKWAREVEIKYNKYLRRISQVV